MKADETRTSKRDLLENNPSILSNAQHQRKPEFIARGLHSRDKAKQTGSYIVADTVLKRLDSILTQTKDSNKTK